MEKTDARKLSTEAQQQLRNQAIRLRKAGRKYGEIAEITGVHETTVCKWYKAYLRDGRSAVRIKQRGRPKGACRTLTADQEKELQKAIRDKCPDQMKLPFALWTRVAVQQLIKQLWAIEMPIRTVGHAPKTIESSVQTKSQGCKSLAGY